MDNHTWGLLAEYFVIMRYLAYGYIPIKHRWNNKLGEIDLIFKRGSSIIFCEVKARSSDFNVESPVTTNQKQRLIKSADHFLSMNQRMKIKSVRFDLAIVKSIFRVQIHKGWIGW